MNAWAEFLNNNDKLIHKFEHYFPIYERHFKSYANKSLVFLEIGVSEGGSLQLWRKFFGPLAVIVGIDIDPNCKRHESPGINIRIGDQSDPVFLDSIIKEFGSPDIVLDDGSHIQAHVLKSFLHLYPKVSKNGVYLIEDLHTAYWPEFGGGIENPNTFINFSKRCVDKINAYYTRGAIQSDLITSQTRSIAFYDSVICYEKGYINRRNLTPKSRNSTDVDTVNSQRVFDKLCGRIDHEVESIPVVTINYNTPELVSDLIGSLRNFYRNRVYVIDGSDDPEKAASVRALTMKYDNVELIPFGYNIHHGPGMAWAFANLNLGNKVLVMDSDCTVLKSGFIESMVEHLKVDMYGVGCLTSISESGYPPKEGELGFPYLSAVLMLLNLQIVKQFPLPTKHGAPMLSPMLSLHKQGLSHLLKNIDWVFEDLTENSAKRYIEHPWQGTSSRTGGYHLA